MGEGSRPHRWHCPHHPSWDTTAAGTEWGAALLKRRLFAGCQTELGHYRAPPAWGTWPGTQATEPGVQEHQRWLGGKGQTFHLALGRGWWALLPVPQHGIVAGGIVQHRERGGMEGLLRSSCSLGRACCCCPDLASPRTASGAHGVRLPVSCSSPLPSSVGRGCAIFGVHPQASPLTPPPPGLEALVHPDPLGSQVSLPPRPAALPGVGAAACRLCGLSCFHSYLHACDPPIIHGNLTSDTIFIQHNGLVKIGSGVLSPGFDPLGGRGCKGTIVPKWQPSLAPGTPGTHRETSSSSLPTLSALRDGWEQKP